MDCACAESSGHREGGSDVGAYTTGAVCNREVGIGSGRDGEAGQEIRSRRSMDQDRDDLGIPPGSHIFGDFRGGIVIGISKLLEMDGAYSGGAGHCEGRSDVGAYTGGAVRNRETRSGSGRDSEIG